MDNEHDEVESQQMQVGHLIAALKTMGDAERIWLLDSNGEVPLMGLSNPETGVVILF